MTNTTVTIEETFVALEEYAINYLKDTLSIYKKELRVKAI
jgi:molybdopterin synthase catalytic subunit